MFLQVYEPLQVGPIITNIPPSWNDYRKKLMYTTKYFTIEQNQKHLRIEDETRICDKKLLFPPSSSKVNYVDEENEFKNNLVGNKRKYNDFNNSNNNIPSFETHTSILHC
jgi:hypothetical protein